MKNFKHNHHLNSKYWQDYKKTLPLVCEQVFQIAFAMVLSDASIYKTSREAHIKFEQGYKQKAFLNHLFTLFSLYCFMEKPGKRFFLDKQKLKTDEIKSFWFKTFSYPCFTFIYKLFYNILDNKIVYKNKRKAIQPNLILNHLTPRGLAYWIMADGSLQNDKKSLILHTQGFSFSENSILSKELNEKFNLNTKVIKHKQKYYVIKTNSKDAITIFNLIKSFMIDSMKYKLPRMG